MSVIDHICYDLIYEKQGSVDKTTVLYPSDSGLISVKTKYLTLTDHNFTTNYIAKDTET